MKAVDAVPSRIAFIRKNQEPPAPFSTNNVDTKRPRSSVSARQKFNRHHQPFWVNWGHQERVPHLGCSEILATNWEFSV